MTRRSMTSKVRQAFRADVLADICTLQDFSAFAPRFNLPPTKWSNDRFFHYVDNGSDVLGIAHLDSVQHDGTANIVETAAGLLVTSGTLDDRLGAYVILDLLPRLGITCDWLLTTDEESGGSTAEDFAYGFFDPEDGEVLKQYNWMFQFDRGGTDVVCYDYETPELVELIQASGARVGDGIFSDICVLESLGCVGVNWGVGYEDYHGPRSHAWLEDTFRMVGCFVKFWQANHKTFIEHDPVGDRFDLDDLEQEYIDWWEMNHPSDLAPMVPSTVPENEQEVA